MSDITFPEGISVFKPHERAPEFVKANITVDAKKLQEWLQTHPELRDAEGRVRLVVKESSKEGNKWYLQVDTYRPEPKAQSANGLPEEVKAEDIPF